MEINFITLLLAAIIPMITGFIWYSPKLFGNAWMKTIGLKKEDIEGGNMIKIFGLSYFFSFLLATALMPMVIHQWGVFSTLGAPTEGVDLNAFNSFMESYGNNFRTFKHGAFHGVLMGIFFVLPVLGTNALFEQKSFKYIAINVGYWILTLALMGGVICQFG